MFLNVIDFHQSADFLQWDIVIDFSFPHIISLADWKLIIKQKKEAIMLLNQSCDLVIDRNSNDYFSFAPIILLSDLKNILSALPDMTDTKLNDKINSMKKNKSYSYVYLPYHKIIWDESFIVLSEIMSLDINLLKTYELKIRLSDIWRHYLSDRLHIHFCRAVDPTDNR